MPSETAELVDRVRSYMDTRVMRRNREETIHMMNAATKGQVELTETDVLALLAIAEATIPSYAIAPTQHSTWENSPSQKSTVVVNEPGLRVVIAGETKAHPKSNSLLEAQARATDLVREASDAVDAAFRAVDTLEANCSFYNWLLPENELGALKTLKNRLTLARTEVSESVGLATRFETSCVIPSDLSGKLKPMAGAPKGRPFLARFKEIPADSSRATRYILPQTVFCRHRVDDQGALFHRNVADTHRWEVRGYPVYCRDDEFDGWAELPEGFTDISFPEV